ncbi:MAG TPA: hypothetical protein EYG90_01100 [Campylobacterales bacterium]|nr:hypothetical protein [Campylobacterales bacterium]
MKKIVTLLILCNLFLLPSGTEDNRSDSKIRMEKQIQKEIEKEKRYAQEKTFYQAKDYDFKGAEVNAESLESLPELEEDDFNMDSVYD